MALSLCQKTVLQTIDIGRNIISTTELVHYLPYLKVLSSILLHRRSVNR